MLNGRLVSVKEIIRNVLRDNTYKGQDFRYSDVIEWAAEALDLIGVPMTLSRRLACIEITDHRGLLPCDLHTINQVSGLLSSGVQFPMREANNTFHPLFLPNPASYGIISPTEPITYTADGDPVFNFLNYEAAVPKETVNMLPYSYKDVTYNTNDNYIFTSFKDGAWVLMSYFAFPVDQEGFPLVPDNIKFKQALQAYVRMKMDYKLWRTGKVSSEIYNHAEREWAWYCGAATNAGLIPTIDGMESWKNQTMHLIPRMNEHAKMFDTLGNQEYLSFGQAFYRY